MQIHSWEKIAFDKPVVTSLTHSPLYEFPYPLVDLILLLHISLQRSPDVIINYREFIGNLK